MFNKLLRKPLKLIDALFWTDYAMRALNKHIGFHNPDYSFNNNEIAFVHIPKSGGTTLNEILCNANTNSRFANLNMHRPISQSCNPERYNYITIMRDPVDRVWSYYQMALRADKDNPYHRFSVKGLEFFLNHCWEVRNMACRYYSGQVYWEPTIQSLEIALGNLKYFSWILDFDNFETDLKIFLSEHGIDRTVIPHERKSRYAEPNQNDCDCIADYNRLDIELFEAWKRE